MKHILALLTAALVTALPAFSQEKGISAITIEETMKHITYLSADALEGRRTGSEGNKAAAAYISAAAASLGVSPLPGQNSLLHPLHYLRVTPLPGEAKITARDTTGTELQTCEIVPLLPPSDSVSVNGEVAFAGYGYLNSEEKYNDFEGMSFRDKIVIVMTRTPDLKVSGMPARGKGISEVSEMNKLTMIFLQRAKAVLFVADPALGTDLSYDMLSLGSSTYQLTPLFQRQLFSFNINAYAISGATADLLLGRAGLTLRKMQDSIASSGKPASFVIPGLRADLKVKVSKDTVVSHNIIGYIEGSDPVLKKECVIYTAHYDHIGRDQAGNIYNGANDNASGSVGLLNIARAFASLAKKPLRSIVFFWTTGEEEGLHGSTYYVSNPLFPLDKTVAAINFDMIGRSRRESDTVSSISGMVDITGRDTIKLISTGETPRLVKIAREASAGSGIVALDEGKGTHFSGSDHYPFYRKGVPVLFFFSGLHSDYHRVTDDFEFVDIEKLIKVSRAGFLTGYKLASDPGRPLPDTKRS